MEGNDLILHLAQHAAIERFEHTTKSLNADYEPHTTESDKHVRCVLYNASGHVGKSTRNRTVDGHMYRLKTAVKEFIVSCELSVAGYAMRAGERVVHFI